jgi:magnesium transporter
MNERAITDRTADDPPMNGRPAPSCLIVDPDGRVSTLDGANLDRISDLRRRPDTLAWLDVTDPHDDEIGKLEAEFNLHPLAVEDLRKRRQRPKVDTYPGQHVIVTYEVRPGQAGRRSFDLGEIHLFATADSLMSVHWGPSPAIDDVRSRLAQRASGVGRSVGAILYGVLDAVVDGYFPLLDGMSDRIDRLEDRIVAGQQSNTTLRDVLTIKRELLDLRRVLAPQRDMANKLLRREVELLDDEAAPYYQDLYYHLVRVLDQLDLYRDLVASTLDANLSVTSNNLNAVMKRLTAFTVVLMLPTLVASIYGMNFHVIPGLDSPIGFWASLIGMLLLALAAGAYFRARDWF